jgi:hypothetical protein
VQEHTVFAITHKFKEAEGELDSLQVFYYSAHKVEDPTDYEKTVDQVEHSEVVRVYLDRPELCEEALEHAIIALRHRLRASKAGG